jgi:hypothetical protein
MRRFVWIALAACAGAPPPAKPPPVATARVAPPAANQLATPAAFDAIPDRAARSRALFGEIAKVLTHARCVNCHTPDETPRQGDSHQIHDPPVARGTGDRGVAGMMCTGCHQDHNVELARVPGAPGWHLAPPAMVWLDRSPGQICEQMKDRARNGQRSLAQIQDHLAHDRLVAWGWTPGADRTAAPGSQEALGVLATAWIETGAECPTEVVK